jgi:hypothetical protein
MASDLSSDLHSSLRVPTIIIGTGRMRIQSDSLGVITDRHVEIHLFGMGASPIAVSLGII